MRYEVFDDQASPAVWRVQAINWNGDKECYTAVFMGADAQRRAKEYAAWKSLQDPDTGEAAALGREIVASIKEHEEALVDHLAFAIKDEFLPLFGKVGHRIQEFKHNQTATAELVKSHGNPLYPKGS